MAEKKKWTLIDTIIVIAVVAAGVIVFNMFNTKTIGGDKTSISAVVLMQNQDPSIAEAMTVGDSVTVSLTEKDGGTLTDLRAEQATTMSYNAIEGKYVMADIEGRVDIYATVEMDVSETDYAFTAGSTIVQVGTELPFRGKGYATEGFVIDIKEGADNE